MIQETLRLAIDRLRDGTWMNSRRIRAYSLILFAIQVATMLFLAAGLHGLVIPFHTPITTDFSSFYSAGWLVDQGKAALAYDLAAHKLAQQTIYGDPGVNYNFFFYPPMLLLLCAVLATMPYLVSFYVWVVAQTLLFLAAIRAIVGRGATLLPYLAFPAAVIAFALGQNALLTAALFGGGTVMLARGRPFLAGLILGCLCYKPHFGILIPVALIAGGHWRAVAGATTAVAVLVGAATLAFGPGIWMAYLHLFTSTAPGTFESGRIPHSALISPFATVLLVGGGKTLAYAIQGLCTLMAAVVVALVWRGTANPAPRSMALIAGTMVSVPVILIYDMLPTTVCLAWLAWDARATGWRPWEKALIIAIYAVALGGRSLAMLWHIPYGPFIGVALLVMAWNRRRPRPLDAARDRGEWQERFAQV